MAVESPAKTAPPLVDLDFDRNPFIVIWELTRACALACVHCRACAIPKRHPEELDTEEGLALLREITRFGSPLVVLTGGDPMARPDVYRFITQGVDLGLRMTLTPSATPAMTEKKIRRLKSLGLARLAVSLDGSSERVHDAFRRVEGSYRWTLDIVEYAHKAGLPVQINTTVTRRNIADFDDIAALVRDLGIVLWSVFFLVPTGRAKPEDSLDGSEYEWIFNRLYEISKTAPFDVKTTAAPHYRRVVHQRLLSERAEPVGVAGPGFDLSDGIGRAKGVNDGKGFIFISHIGEVYPSGFLPIVAGNVRHESIVSIYRDSRLFRDLRNPMLLKGKCGVCEYSELCGGSRARAYGMTGDHLAEEPLCVHEPRTGGEAR